MDFSELAPLLSANADLDQLVSVLAGLSEQQRRTLSVQVVQAQSKAYSPEWSQSALTLALLGCVSGMEKVAMELRWSVMDPDVLNDLLLTAQVLKDRDPPWLADLPKALFDTSDMRAGPRQVVRALVRTGLVDAPDLPGYHCGLALGLIHHAHGEYGILDALRDDPGILEGELWQMLTSEGAGSALAGWDNSCVQPWARPPAPPPPATPERTWQHALVTLAAEGRISRDRLLDETLTACLRDWKANDIVWYVGLHDALAPTVGESAAREHVYRRLLAAQPQRAVCLAQRHLTRLLDADHLHVPSLLEASPPPLNRSDKRTVLAQLKLLHAVGTRHPELSSQVAEVMAEALGHERTDVQEHGLKLIIKLLPDHEDRNSLIQSRLATLAPSLRPSGSAPDESPQGDANVVRPRVALPVQPVGDADELAGLLGRLMEEAEDSVDVERALEGVARLARQRPRAGADVLVRRAEALLDRRYPGPWSGEDIRGDLAALTRVWLTGAHPGPGPRGREGHELREEKYVTTFAPDWTLSSVVTLRIHEIARIVAQGGAQILSLPTHRNGTIAPGALSGRVRSLSRSARPWPLDTGVAALRLAPQTWPELDLPAAHRTAQALRGYLQQLRNYQPRWEAVIGTGDPTRYGIVARGATWRDTASHSGNGGDVVSAVLDRHDPLPLLSFEAHHGEDSNRFEQVTAMWPLMLPHHPELLAAHSHPRLNRSLAQNRSGMEPLIDTLATISVISGPVVCSALALGLSARNGLERTHAVDAFVDLSEQGNLDGTQLGLQISWLLTGGVVTGQRVVQSLAESARGSTNAANAVLDAVQAVMPVLPGRKEAHVFVDLAAQLATRTGRSIRLPDQFLALRAGRSSSAVAAACRRVPLSV